MGREFWCCATNTDEGGCKFFKFDVALPTDPKPWTSRKRPAVSAPSAGSVSTDELAQTLGSLVAKVDSLFEIVVGLTAHLKKPQTFV